MPNVTTAPVLVPISVFIMQYSRADDLSTFSFVLKCISVFSVIYYRKRRKLRQSSSFMGKQKKSLMRPYPQSS